MHLVFLDESGHSPNWTSDIASQPFYVLAATCVEASLYSDACDEVRQRAAQIGVQTTHPLGKGSEIKARAVARGEGWWSDHNDERNQFRELMLSFPVKHKGAAFVVVVDKERHRKQYVSPQDPPELAMQFLFERLQWHLRNIDSHAYCIYDHDKRRTDALHNQSAHLIREGTGVMFFSKFYGDMVTTTNQLDRITELALGKSDNSIGLQVADFFATMTYCYFRDGKPKKCGWWDTLCASLFRKNDQLFGWGLKVFP